MSDFETWWQQEGQEFLYALNTTTDDDIKLVAEFAWKNGAYKAEQPISQEPVAVVEITYGREPECYVTGNVDDLPEGVFKLYTAPQPVSQEPVKREHITDGSPCWCNPELNYKDPETGAEVWIHKEPQ